MGDKRAEKIQAMVAQVNSLSQSGRPEEAITLAFKCERALAELGEAGNRARARHWGVIGYLHREICEIDLAQEAFDQALRLAEPGPLFDVLRLGRAFLIEPMIRSAASIKSTRARFQKELEALERDPPLVANLLDELHTLHFFLAYHGENDRELMELQQRVMRKVCPSLFWRASWLEERRLQAKPRIGFLSTYFKDHTVGRLNAVFMERLNRDGFQKILFLVEGEADAFTRDLQAGMDQVVSIPRDIRAARERIALEKLDLLYFAEIGMDPFIYYLACAKMARFQLSTWGHPVTSGLPAMDGFIIGDQMEPSHGQAHFTERLLRIKAPNVVYPRPRLMDNVKDRGKFGLPREGALYLCPQASFKFHPDFDQIIAEILRRDPTGRIVLLKPKYEAWKRILVDRWKACQVDIKRLVFLRTMPRHDFLALLALGDVMLDPFPFGGGNTILEALAFGTPVVTWPTEQVRGRLGYSFLKYSGLSTGIVSSAEEYVSTAVRLAKSDQEARARMRAEVVQKSSSMFDDFSPIDQLSELLSTVISGAANN